MFACIAARPRVFDAGGVPVVGSQDVKFAIYDQELGGVEIWTETISIDFDEGFFSVRLGEQALLDEVVFDGSTRWLGITVGNDPEMTPRAAVESVPYAMFAGDVRGVLQPPRDARRIIRGARERLPARDLVLQLLQPAQVVAHVPDGRVRDHPLSNSHPCRPPPTRRPRRYRPTTPVPLISLSSISS